MKFLYGFLEFSYFINGSAKVPLHYISHNHKKVVNSDFYLGSHVFLSTFIRTHCTSERQLC